MTKKPVTWGELRDMLRDCPGCETARLLCADDTPFWARGVAQVAVYAVRGHDFWHVLAGQFVEPIGYTPRLEGSFEGWIDDDVPLAVGRLTAAVYAWENRTR